MEQKLKSELTKQIILDKSFNLFYEFGFKSTSIDKIMLTTGLSKGAFYHHFKNKKEIGLAVITEKIKHRVYNGMIAPLYESENAIETLELIFIGRLQSFSLYEKQHGCPMNNLINEVGDLETAYQLALQRIIEEWKSALIHLIESGKTNKTIKETVSASATAIYLISAFEGIRGIRKLYNNDSVLEQYINGLKFYLEQLKS